jgi:hypothetical protein
MKAILGWYQSGLKALINDIPYNQIVKMKVLEKIGRMKYIKESVFEKECAHIMADLESEFLALEKGGELHV